LQSDEIEASRTRGIMKFNLTILVKYGMVALTV